jgi:hypothetical protein
MRHGKKRTRLRRSIRGGEKIMPGMMEQGSARAARRYRRTGVCRRGLPLLRAHCIAASNRNLENRQGAGSRTHLASPATVLFPPALQRSSAP